MRFEDKTQSFHLSDDELTEVSGGCTIQNERYEEIKEGRFVTSALSNYSNGEMPKYAVGDIVKIKWHVSSNLEVLCNAETAVSCSESTHMRLKFCPAPTVI